MSRERGGKDSRHGAQYVQRHGGVRDQDEVQELQIS